MALTPEQQAALSYSSNPPPAVDPLRMPLNTTPDPTVQGASGVPPIGADVPGATVPSSVPQTPVAEPAAPSVPAIPVIPSGATPDHVRAASRSATPATPAEPSQLEKDAEAARAADAKQLETAKNANEDEADSLEAQAELKRKQAADLQTQQRLQQLDREDSDKRIADAFREFREKKRTSFFADKTVLQDVAMGLGAILGSVSFSENHQNEALNTIDRAIHRHMEQQEAERSDLFKGIELAQQQGQRLRSDQIQELANLRLDQALTLEAVIDQGKAMASRSKNKAGIAAIESNNARLAMERDKMIDDTKRLDGAAAETRRHNRAEEGIQREHVGILKANAAGGVGGAPTKAEKLAETALQKDETLVNGTARSPGPAIRVQTARSVSQELQHAIDSRDPTRIKAAVASAREQSSRMLTGAAPTSISTHLVTELQSPADQFEAKLSGFLGRPTESIKFAKSIKTLVDGMVAEGTATLSQMQKRTQEKYDATSWVQRSPELKQAVNARIKAIYNIGEPEGSAFTPPPGSKQGKLSNGTIAYRYPDGTVHDANGNLIK